jgi:2-keto-4-pentenoate hydratase
MTEQLALQGMHAQMERRQALLDGGAEHLGWKVGLNPPAVYGNVGLDAPIAAFLTRSTLLESGATFQLPGGDAPVMVEAELAFEVGADGVSVAALMPALEVVEIDTPLAQVDDVLAGGIFHRAVVLGPRVEVEAAGTGRQVHNGETFADLDASSALDGIVELLGRRLGEVGERLAPGDLVISGALVPPVQVGAGDTVRIELEPLGAAEVAFA